MSPTTPGRPRPTALAIVVLSIVGLGAGEPPFELKDGDRVVAIGGTFTEREASFGFLETMLTSAYPDRNITFRNLGWSGDTVWGEARSRFGPASEGFAHLKAHVEALKPTVVLVDYGLNESFAGRAGLPRFEAGLATLLDLIDGTGARVVVITPRKLENLGPPLPDPAATNERLGAYVAALRSAAVRRNYRLVDLHATWPPDPAAPLTENGLHLGEAGYRRAAVEIARALGIAPTPVRAEFDAGGKVVASSGTRASMASKTSGVLRFDLKDDRLPPPRGGPDRRRISVAGAEPGDYTVKVDGVAVGSGSTRSGALEIALDGGPEADAAEALRAAIVAKNELYFYRWRPQNETYLFGFRKHEQGNNAREIPLFDPLVAEAEARIAGLRAPKAHRYEVARTGGTP